MACMGFASTTRWMCRSTGSASRNSKAVGSVSGAQREEGRGAPARRGEGAGRAMRRVINRKLALVGCLLAAVSPTAAQQTSTSGRPTLFEGARLIAGDGTPPIENAAFSVERGRFTRVGRKGELSAASGSARIDLTGKTVIPGLI